MAPNNIPPREVVLAYSRKAQRISQEVEKMARVGIGWIDKSVMKELWLAQITLYHIAAILKEDSSL